MPNSSYMPAKQAEQVQWAATFMSVVGGQAAQYGVSAALMTEFDALNNTLQSAWSAAVEPSTRTKGTVAAKDAALREMKRAAKNLVSIIQGTPGVTEQMKVDAGLTVRKTHPSPKPAPTEQPLIQVKKVSGRNVTIELRQDAQRRAKPAAVTNALLFTYAGETAPMDTNLGSFVTTTTSRTVTIPFPPSATGDRVWVTAMWANAKAETGPAADPPVFVDLPAGGVLPTEAASERPVRQAA